MLHNAKLLDHRSKGSVSALPANGPAMPAPATPLQPGAQPNAPTPTPGATPQGLPGQQQPQATPAQPNANPQAPLLPGQQPAQPVQPGQQAQQQPGEDRTRFFESMYRRTHDLLAQYDPNLHQRIKAELKQPGGGQPPVQPGSPTPAQQSQRDVFGRFLPTAPQEPAGAPQYPQAFSPFAPPQAAPAGYPNYQYPPPPAQPGAAPGYADPYGLGEPNPYANPYANPAMNPQMMMQQMAHMVSQTVHEALGHYGQAQQAAQEQTAVRNEMADVRRQLAEFESGLIGPDKKPLLTPELKEAVLRQAASRMVDWNKPGGPTQNLLLLVEQVELALARQGNPAFVIQLAADAQAQAQGTLLAQQPAPMGGPGTPSETQTKLARYQGVAGRSPGDLLGGKLG